MATKNWSGMAQVTNTVYAPLLEQELRAIFTPSEAKAMTERIRREGKVMDVLSARYGGDHARPER